MKRNGPEQWEKRLAEPPVMRGEAGFTEQLRRKVRERVEVEQRPRKAGWVKWSPVLLMCVLSVFALTKQEQLEGMIRQLSKPANPAVLEPMDAEEETTLKVAYFHEATFMADYGKAFTIRYPNVDVQVIPSGEVGWNTGDAQALAELIDKENPDVLYMSPQMYAELAKEGRLYPLDEVMRQDRYDLQAVYGGVTDELRRLGGGKLYGVSPIYEMEALYYNKDVFDRYGVPYPKSGMSWEEVLQLAARFPANGKGEERMYGLAPSYYDDASALAARIGKTQGLSLIDAEGKQATVHTEGWNKAWELALDGYRKGYVFRPEPRPEGNILMQDMLKTNPFVTGHAAMALSGFSMSGNLKMAQNQYKMSPFTWDIVSEPVDPARPDESASFTLGPVFAINAKSDKLRTSWEMLKLIDSEEIAKKQNLSSFGGSLNVRLQTVKPDDAHNYAPFYTMKPAKTADIPLHPRVLRKFNEAFAPLAAQQAKTILEGRAKLDDALRQLQDDAQQALFGAMLDSRN
ncbi:Bacterial extracellular solute-binding protein [Paenibacillus konkukensis]|uniref:Bacterial extracellular solute-binding protein n=1 Tax=Paenibacillus konkukensis TaxID=2020716 RepID=A0ABY4RRX9_9BACL|nr:extracellular solute-binding protein [Paenibacillus konkukensis]UQZ85306.1 Bacterial extracellular solute-binding protein [Paenibacillus konkukensis]